MSTKTAALRPDGPHSVDSTVELARLHAETVRVLNYATSPGNAASGLEYPSAIYSLIGGLRTAVSGYEQLFKQTVERLDSLDRADVLSVTYGRYAGNPGSAVEEFAEAMAQARIAAGGLLRALDRAHAAVSPIGLEEA